MSNIPSDFGGLVSYWIDSNMARLANLPGPRAVVSRYGNGQAVEGLTLTPLNLLQLQKIVADLVARGCREGFITDEHVSQSEQLPITEGVENVQSRAEVDRIAGLD